MIKDIKSYLPMNNQQEFCLDTNVLYWYCYPRYVSNLNPKRQNEIEPYYEFVDRLVQNGNPIYTSIYNISEFLNIIEKHECAIFQQINPEVPAKVKDLRNFPEQREKLKGIMKVALNNVYQVCKVVEFGIKIDVLNSFVEQLNSHKCDVFDYVILKQYLLENKLSIVTDDADFMTIDGINIFTSNENML